jgi:hypothetical protein
LRYYLSKNGVEGALRFFVDGRSPKEAEISFSKTLMVTDAFGGEHKLSIGGKPPHPSDRLLEPGKSDFFFA